MDPWYSKTLRERKAEQESGAKKALLLQRRQEWVTISRNAKNGLFYTGSDYVTKRRREDREDCV